MKMKGKSAIMIKKANKGISDFIKNKEKLTNPKDNGTEGIKNVLIGVKEGSLEIFLERIYYLKLIRT